MPSYKDMIIVEKWTTMVTGHFEQIITQIYTQIYTQYTHTHIRTMKIMLSDGNGCLSMINLETDSRNITINQPASKLVMLATLSKHWGWIKITTILKMTFSVTFSCLKIVVSGLNFHWNLFQMAQSVPMQHRFRYRLNSLTHMYVTHPQWHLYASAN